MKKYEENIEIKKYIYVYIIRINTAGVLVKQNPGGAFTAFTARAARRSRRGGLQPLIGRWGQGPAHSSAVQRDLRTSS